MYARRNAHRIISTDGWKTNNQFDYKLKLPSRGGCPTENTGLGPELKPAEVAVVHSEWQMKSLEILDDSPKAQN